MINKTLKRANDKLVDQQNEQAPKNQFGEDVVSMQMKNRHRIQPLRHRSKLRGDTPTMSRGNSVKRENIPAPMEDVVQESEPELQNAMRDADGVKLKAKRPPKS